MKKIFTFLATSALVVLAASCAKEQQIAAVPAGEETTVEFTVATPELMTKAIADGNTVDKVSCSVYGADGLIADLSKVIDMAGGKATFSVRLVTGQTYSFLFWAYKDGAPYTLDADAKTVEVSYAGASNDESRDAFYAYVADRKITGSVTETVTLKRPFAQVNFGVEPDDITAAKTAGYEVKKSSVKITGLANKLNLTDGSVSGEVDAEFTVADLPAETEKLTVNKKDYRYVATNYVLVGADKKQLSDVELKIYDGTNAEPINTVSVPNVPLQGNYRTNILGNLFTSLATYNIVVESSFEEPDNSIIRVSVASQEDLDAALTSASAAGADLILSVSGEVTLPDYSTSVTYPRKIVINGTKGAVVKIDHRCVATDCEIEFNNVTVKNAIGNVYVNGGTNDDSWPQLKDAKNLTFTGCTIEEQLKIVVKGTATFTNCTFTNQTKSGYDGYCLNYYNYTGSKVVVENCNFTAPEKGILIWGDKVTEYDLTVNNCTFTATAYPSTGGTNDKGAVQINSESSITGVVCINKCTATGFNTTSDANGLWFEVDNQPWQNAHYGQPNSHFNIYVDGVQVQKSDM